jgi:hypothetical protein
VLATLAVPSVRRLGRVPQPSLAGQGAAAHS